MIKTDFQRREFANGEELAHGLADWTAEHLARRDCGARRRAADCFGRQIPRAVL